MRSAFVEDRLMLIESRLFVLQLHVMIRLNVQLGPSSGGDGQRWRTLCMADEMVKNRFEHY